MTADSGVAEACPGCGATVAAGAAWCGQCYLPRRVAPVATVAAGERSIMSGTNAQAAAAGPRPMVSTRWKKTPTTFGPVGRVVCTVLLLVPLPLFIIGTVVAGVGIIGLGVWVLVIMPWALKDIWKAGMIPAG